MPQINFNKLYDVIVNWFKPIPPKESRWNTTPSEQLGKKLAEEHLEIIKDALFDKSIHIVKGVTQVDESLLAEYQNVPGWHRKYNDPVSDLEALFEGQDFDPDIWQEIIDEPYG